MGSLEEYFEVVRMNGRVELRPKGPTELFITGLVMPVTFNIPGGAVAADYDGVPFVADRQFEVVDVRERHLVAGTDAGAVTLMVKKVASGQAPAAGTDVLASGINLKGTANTPVQGALHATLDNRRLRAGEGLALVPSGVLTAVDGVSVTIYVRVLAL